MRGREAWHSPERTISSTRCASPKPSLKNMEETSAGISSTRDDWCSVCIVLV